METCAEAAARSGPDAARGRDGAEGRILALSSWMIVLGTAHVLCAAAGYWGDYQEFARYGPRSWRQVALFLQENSPIALLGTAWPLALGLIVRRTGGRAYLHAAALTFLILSLAGIATLFSGLLLRSDETVVFGSFVVSRPALIHFHPAALLRGLLGVVQLALELGTAVSALSLAWSPSARPGPAGEGAGAARRRLRGRMAVYLSLAFLVFSVRAPAWSAYLALLQRSSLVRDFVLRNDSKRHVPYNMAFIQAPPPRAGFDLEMGLSDALRLAGLDHFEDARRAYLDVIARAEAINREAGSPGPANLPLGRALNNLAWLLCTCAEPRLRQPKEAVEYARRAVGLDPEEGTYWNTLGVAHYRAGNLDAAAEALEESMRLRGEGDGDAFDWYFLAMIDARRGRKDPARRWYDRAVAWTGRSQPDDPELYRFRVEAADLLGLEKPAPPPARTTREPVGAGLHPGLLRKRLRDGPTLAPPRL